VRKPRWVARLEKQADRAVLWGRIGSGALLLLLGAGAVLGADLTPRVDPNFFFSSDDPQFQAHQKIAEMFPESAQFFLSARGEMESAGYQRGITAITEEAESLPGVESVYSILQGPGGPETAQESPFWKRLLIAEQGKASNILIFAKMETAADLVPRLEAIRDRHARPDFDLILSGVPYVSKLIQRNLSRDLKVFGLAAFLVFGSAIWWIFRSLRMALGTAVACLNAAAGTLILCRILEIPIGLLTANLITVLFVLTLSHILFLTFSWRHAVMESKRTERKTFFDAAERTLPASFWSMVTTLLGFGSLLFAQAEPLKHMGISGMIGTLAAFGAAYGCYLWFLPPPETLRAAPEALERMEAAGKRPFARRHIRFTAGLVLVSGLVSIGTVRLNTDPPLLSYFKEGDEIHRGLAYIDRNLGSSPLQVVVKSRQGAAFNTTEAYEHLWRLHDALEAHPMVGSVISLPLIMAEAKRTPVISLLPWEWLFKLIQMTPFSDIAGRFVTRDRKQGLFFLMMQENERSGTPRVRIIDQILQIVRDQGFEPELVGGVYLLQGRMAQMITSSLITGLTLLIGLFVAMSGWLARSWRVAGGVFAGLALIPLWTMGWLGWLGIPFDIISSPAPNIAVAMGVDGMIHLILWARRHAQGKEISWETWRRACLWLWEPIFFSAAIVVLGFSVFGLSAFPPTQRFGLSIVLGTILAPLATLFVLPAASLLKRRRDRP